MDVRRCRDHVKHARRHRHTQPLHVGALDRTTVGNPWTFSGSVTLGSTLKVGSSGTTMAGLMAGSCTIWSSQNTITGTTTSQVECQTGGAVLTTTLSGVTADAICELTPPLAASSGLVDLILQGAVASSTDAGTITAHLASVGTSFTWTAAASSSWQYICVDPS